MRNVTSYGSMRVSRAFIEYLQAEAAGGIIMMSAAALALVVANSALAGTYETFWHQYAGLSFAGWALELSLHHWVNDGLMAVFFFLVGLEIKRELLFGELASPRRAALPVIAALGGAAVPALIYVAFNAGGEHPQGWGVPMATDIAFAVTVLALLGSRAPLWLKSFVTALAIADDIMAVLVIAVFYSGALDLVAIAWATGCAFALAALNLSRVMRPAPYVLIGIVMWYFVLQSGVHATIAGVVTAAFVPASLGRAAERLRDSAVEIRQLARELTEAEGLREAWEVIDEREAELEDIAHAVSRQSAPLYRLEHAIHPWSAYVILPVFAFANAGIQISLSGLGATLTTPLALGIMLGLFLGKQVGITGAAWLAVRLGAGTLPEGARWSQIWGGAALAGIGFTMSIFIAALAFPDTGTLQVAKLAVVIGSLASAAAGVALLSLANRPDEA
ncbi:MAG TPA: Na+/H+ antiporter NhaA [Gemmatimonadota bacterium]|nr:Na+/H+ antiporter NhaA [Gemmatimonadota bacterium]